MGFHIPDSPREAPPKPNAEIDRSVGRVVSHLAPIAARRRNIEIPPLDLSILGSPRSPFICLSISNRLAGAADQVQERKLVPAVHRRSDYGKSVYFFLNMQS